MKNPKVAQRVEQLKEEHAKLATISREKIISDDVKILDLDPLDLWIFDERKGAWRMRFLHEIPKETRKLLKFRRNGRGVVPEVDKDAAKKRLIEVLGYASPKDLNVTTNIGNGELRIGFDDDDDYFSNES